VSSEYEPSNSPDDAHPGHADELGVADADGAVVVRAAGHHPRRADRLPARHLRVRHDSSYRQWLSSHMGADWRRVVQLDTLLTGRHVASITQ